MIKLKVPKTLRSSSLFTTALKTSSTLSAASNEAEDSITVNKSVKSFEDIPGPRRFPLLGNLLHYKLGIYDRNNYQEVLRRLNKEYGPIVREDLGPKNSVIHIFSPDDARTVYAAEGRTPIINPLQETIKLYRKISNLSPGLGNTNGEEWYRLRSAIRHLMLQPREVAQYLPEVDEAAKLLTDRISERKDENGEVSSLNTDVAKWSQESAGRVCFGRSLGCLAGGHQEEKMDEIIKFNRQMFRISCDLKFSFPFYQFMPTPKWKHLCKAEEALVSHTEKNTKTTIEEIDEIVKNEGQVPERFSYMSHLLASNDLSSKDINIITLSLFLDGLSTTVPTVLFNLYNLAKNPEAQDQAYAELSSALPDMNQPLSAKILGNLPYVKAIVKETFRTLPNGTDISRILEKDLILSGYHIPAKTHINLNMTVNFRSKEYFSDPEKFKPERWLRGEEMKSTHPFVLTPFGHGTRTCAGRRFAEQDLYVLLARILRRFKLSYPENAPFRQVFHTLLFPDGPVRIRFTPRSN